MSTPSPANGHGSNNGHFDLTGISNVQKNYLMDMTQSYPNVNNAATVALYVNNLQNKLQGLSQSYVDANTSGAAVLNQQNQVIDIINAEQQRLNEKQYLMNQTKVQQDRIALLNNSYRLRYAQYTKIVIVLIIGLCIHIVLRLIGSYFTQVPNGFLILLHVINILVCLIIISYIYVDILSRDQINFNQIDLPPPTLNGVGGPAAAPDSGSLFGDLGIGCVGEECCGNGTTWNSALGVCGTTNVVTPAPASTPAPTTLNTTSAPPTSTAMPSPSPTQYNPVPVSTPGPAPTTMPIATSSPGSAPTTMPVVPVASPISAPSVSPST